MKTFSQLREDIEMVAAFSKPGKARRGLLGVTETVWRADAAKELRKIKKVGEIKNAFTVYSAINSDADSAHTHFYVAIDNKSKKVVAYTAGDIWKQEYSPAATFVHPDYSSSRMGFSIPAELYLQISKQYAVSSGHSQTVGGASIWKRLMRDLKSGVRLVDADGKKGSPKGVPDNKIWAAHSGNSRLLKTVGKSGMQPQVGEYDEWGRAMSPATSRAFHARLVLPRKK